MILNFTDPFFTTRVLGFEPLFDRLQRLSETSDRSSTYPPYNIRKDGNYFAIEVAVAGLTKEDIQIELSDGVLSVGYDGPKTEVVNGSNEVVYQGIAQRAFKQQFTLAENVVVQGAELVNGLLTVNLEKIIPEEKKSRMIEIKTPKRISSK
ncbi:MAG: molecular chaperone IbpA [Gammaproteobacteria bacterium]|jgi:molecular chaperone IbpA|tara:strand:+ start:158 stop:610 length:453 start_codon:yes stop_codon:yes gene_type:complete